MLARTCQSGMRACTHLSVGNACLHAPVSRECVLARTCMSRMVRASTTPYFKIPASAFIQRRGRSAMRAAGITSPLGLRRVARHRPPAFCRMVRMGWDRQIGQSCTIRPVFPDKGAFHGTITSSGSYSNPSPQAAAANPSGLWRSIASASRLTKRRRVTTPSGSRQASDRVPWAMVA